MISTENQPLLHIIGGYSAAGASFPVK